MNKLNFENIRKYIKENSIGECDLIHIDENNTHRILQLKCKCGNIFNRTYLNKSKCKTFQCDECNKKLTQKRYSLSLDEVKKRIKDLGCEYISGEYVNISSKLNIRCKCGNVFTKSFGHFLYQNRCPKCGAESSRQSKFKYDLEKARDIFAKRGYTLLETEYIDCQTLMKVVCKNGHHTTLILSQFLCNSSGCSECAIKRHSGSGHWNYQGGISELTDYFRKHLKQWKKDIMKKYNYKCYLTDNHNDIIVHHLESFSSIVKESCKELKIPIKKHLVDYTEKELSNIYDLVMAKHTINNGVVLQRKVHNKFHSLYGIRNNTLEQFNDFIKKYYPHNQIIKY